MRPFGFVIAVALAAGVEAQTGVQSFPPQGDPPTAPEKAKDVPELTTAEKNKIAKQMDVVRRTATAANPLTRDVTEPGGRFGVDYYPRNGIVAPKAVPKSPKRD